MGDFGPKIWRKMSHRLSGIGFGVRIKGLPSWGDARWKEDVGPNGSTQVPGLSEVCWDP